jgi:hypothetical protein
MGEDEARQDEEEIDGQVPRANDAAGGPPRDEVATEVKPHDPPGGEPTEAREREDLTAPVERRGAAQPPSPHPTGPGVQVPP